MSEPQGHLLHLRVGAVEQDDVVVVMVPFPAQGHLNQLLHLSRLILSRNVPVHYVSTATHNRQAKLRFHHWDPLTAANLWFHDFPVPPFHSPPPDPMAAVKFPSHLQPCFDAVTHLYGPVSDLLRRLASVARKVVVVNDSMMGSVIREVINIPNAASYTFNSVSAFYTFFSLWEYIGKPGINIKPELIPENLPSLDDCFTPEFWASMVVQIEYLPYASGEIYNTNRLIEGDYVDCMEKLEDPTSNTKKKHWALGPFNPVKTVTPSNHFTIEWLDNQPENSVVYVSFGTTTAMTDEQIKEIANGLKQSQQKFIWVLRDADKGDIFSAGEVRRAELPEGFKDSIKNIGLIIRDWTPQLEILAHPATGGFISHCGWNSCMESISMGVPMGAWPMHSDQPRNTVLVTEVLKVGIVVRDWAQRHEVVTAAAVEERVRRLMDSRELREKAAGLGRSVRQSVEEGGGSRQQFDSFLEHVLG